MIPVPAEAGKNTKSAAGGNAARMGVVTMTIKLEQVLKAIEMADDAYTYFYDTQTGETVFLSDAIITGERDEALEELIDNSPEGRFLRFPTKDDIHEYSIMEDFVYSLPSGAARQELVSAICGRGAFRRFKNGIRYHRLEQQWYAYQNQAYRDIAIRWCQNAGIEYQTVEPPTVP